MAASASFALSACPANPARYLASLMIPSNDLSRMTTVGSLALGVSARAGSTVPERARNAAIKERERIGTAPIEGKVESPGRGPSSVSVHTRLFAARCRQLPQVPEPAEFISVSDVARGQDLPPRSLPPARRPLFWPGDCPLYS